MSDPTEVRLKGEITTVTLCKAYGFVTLTVPHDGFVRAVLGSETRGRTDLMNTSGTLVKGTKVVLTEVAPGPQALSVGKVEAA